VDLFRRSEIEKAEFEVDYRIVFRTERSSISTQSAVYLNESGELVEFVGTAIDVTAAKQRKKRCAEQVYLAEAQRLTHTGSWVWQVAGRQASHLSEEWYRVYGFDPEKGMPGWEERLNASIRRIEPIGRGQSRSIRERKSVRSGIPNPSSGRDGQNTSRRSAILF